MRPRSHGTCIPVGQRSLLPITLEIQSQAPTLGPEVHTLGPKVPTPGLEVPTPGSKAPTPGPEAPTPDSKAPTPSPSLRLSLIRLSCHWLFLGPTGPRAFARAVPSARMRFPGYVPARVLGSSTSVRSGHSLRDTSLVALNESAAPVSPSLLPRNDALRARSAAGCCFTRVFAHRPSPVRDKLSEGGDFLKLLSPPWHEDSTRHPPGAQLDC